MKLVAVKFIPKLLIFEQELRRLGFALVLRNRVNNDAELLKPIGIGAHGLTDMTPKSRHNRFLSPSHPNISSIFLHRGGKWKTQDRFSLIRTT